MPFRNSLSLPDKKLSALGSDSLGFRRFNMWVALLELWKGHGCGDGWVWPSPLTAECALGKTGLCQNPSVLP